MRQPSYRTTLTKNESSALKKLIRNQTTPQNKVRRAKIILLANEEEYSNKQIAEELSLYSSDVTKWTKRWIERTEDPIEDRISDLPRSGAPSQITPEQWCSIMALACEPPENYDRPITHWTHRELASEVVKQGIVPSISACYLGEFLKKSRFNPIAVAIG